jgi:hypothetical protein
LDFSFPSVMLGGDINYTTVAAAAAAAAAAIFR